MPDAHTSADRPATLIAIVLLAAVVPTMLMVAPVVVGAFITQYGFTPQQAGNLLSLELGGMAVATLPAMWWMPRFDWRRAVQIALVVMVAGNLAAMGTTAFEPLAALRALTGLAGGSIMVVCLALIGRSAAQERNFGWWVVGQLVVGAIGVEVLPQVVPEHGLGVLFGAIAVALGLLLLTTGAISRGDPAPAAQAQAAPASPLSLKALLGLAAVFLFYVGLSGVWAFVERVGAQRGLAPAQIGHYLTIATVCGIAGCLTATWVGKRLSHGAALLLGFGTLAGSLVVLRTEFAPGTYLLAASAFKYSWTFALPFILARLNTQDTSGRLVVLANLMIGAGLAVGPFITGAGLGNPPDYQGTLPIAVGIVVLSYTLLLALAKAPARVPATAPG